MKAVASLVFGIVCAVGAGIVGISAASAVMSNPEGQHLTTLSEPDLWTSEPVRIDVAKQQYERVEPVYSNYVTDHAGARIATKTPVERSLEADSVQEKVATAAAHRDWCVQRYRSYDEAENTYRSFSGETRTCVSPFAPPSAVAQSADEDRATANVAWCAARYRSYRAKDNTYQPFDGPRRACVPSARQEIAAN